MKSWSDRTWVSNGRMVSGKQLDALTSKADLIVWCQIPDHENGREVILEGWSSVTEMLAFGEPSWWNNYRPQLQLDERYIRAMSELADPERTPAVVSPPARAVRCSHSRHHGVCWACVPFADPDPPAHVRVAAGRSYFHHGDAARLRSSTVTGPLARFLNWWRPMKLRCGEFIRARAVFRVPTTSAPTEGSTRGGLTPLCRARPAAPEA